MTSTQLDDDFDAVTYTTPAPETVVGPESEWDDHHRSRNRDSPRKSDPSGYRDPSGAQRDHGSSTSGFDRYGEYGQYMNEMERMFGGGSVDLEMSIQRLGVDGERSRTHQLGRVRSVSGSSTRSRQAPGRGGGANIPSRLVPVEERPDGSGPKKGQGYKMIERRIIEDGPERTVTISTWREEVARKASPEVEMSVYYVHPDDYTGQRERTGSVTEIEGLQMRRESTLERGAKGKDVSRGVWTEVRIRELMQKLQSLSEQQKRASPPRRTFSETTYPRDGKISPLDRSVSPKHTASPRTPTPNRTPPRMTTPGRASASSPRNVTGAAQPRTPPRTSTPPFHPTECGSTISSIRSMSISSLERVLSSCQPSLLHIAPVLETLGIHNEEHLKAVSRLSEETRDREVRGEALKQGVTIMEWAILLDKLQSLVTG